MTIDEMTAHLMQNRQRLYSIARGMMKNEHDALDMVQETAYRACAKAGSVKKEESVSAWLAAILVNCCRAALRKRKKWTELDVDTLCVPDDTGSVDLREMVEGLLPPYRELILLRYYMDMRPSEIARQLRMPESTVRDRLLRALGALRVQFEEDDI